MTPRTRIGRRGSPRRWPTNPRLLPGPRSSDWRRLRERDAARDAGAAPPSGEPERPASPPDEPAA